MKNTKNKLVDPKHSAHRNFFIISFLLALSNISWADSCEKKIEQKSSPSEIYLSLNKLFIDALKNKNQDLYSCLFVQINLAKSNLLLKRNTYEQEKSNIRKKEISENYDMKTCLIKSRNAAEKEFIESNQESVSTLLSMKNRRSSYQNALLESMSKGSNFWNKPKQDSLKRKINRINELISIQETLISEEVDRIESRLKSQCISPDKKIFSGSDTLSISRKIDEINNILTDIDRLSDAASDASEIHFQ